MFAVKASKRLEMKCIQAANSQPFRSDGSQVTVPMMTADLVLNFVDDSAAGGATVAAIPFQSEGEYFVVAIPGEGQSENRKKNVARFRDKKVF